jgi:hypothetical protein
MRIYLVIRADRTHRTTTRPPRLRHDEIAIPLNVNFPTGWGKVLSQQEITLTAPEIPTVEEVA